MAAVVSGSKELDRKLAQLGEKGAKRASAAGIRAGLVVVSRAIKAAIPAHMKSVKRSIGSRFKKNRRKGVMEAKVGANVGKKAARQVPHAHLILAGTKDRYTGSRTRTSRKGVATTKQTGNRRAFRGRVEGLNAVPRGFASSESRAQQAIVSKLGQTIEREARKQGG